MPIYEYVCKACGEEFEAIQKFTDRPLKKCRCGKAGQVERKLSLSAFQLKGSGWYKDLYAGSNGNGKDKSADGKVGEKSDTSGKPDSKAGEKSDTSSKPDGKAGEKSDTSAKSDGKSEAKADKSDSSKASESAKPKSRGSDASTPA